MLLNKIKKAVQDIWNKYIRYIYSKIIFYTDCKDCEVGFIVKNTKDISDVSKNIYSVFEYSKDMIDEIHTPAQCYINYTKNNFHDDCDGFHLALYHILSKNNIEQWLYTYIPHNMFGHTFLIFRFSKLYGIINYTNIKFGITDIKKIKYLVQKNLYNDDYLAHYIWKWDYEKKKYVNCKESEL